MADELFSKDEVEQIAVLGAGTMGHGIAQVGAMVGCRVLMQDVDDAAVERGMHRIGVNLDKGVARGKVDSAVRDRALELVSGTTSIAEAVANAQIVIEAVPERMDIKKAVFEEVGRKAPPKALLATNTSSFSIADIAASLPASERSRLVGMHFFNPVHIMELLEVVRHEGSSEGAVALACAVAERMNKTAIVVRDVPGFASSRLGIALGLEAMRMVEDGVAGVEDIDTALKLGYGHPMGPLELTDLVGLDVRHAIAEYLAETLGPRFQPPKILGRKVADGQLGKKSGAGFYRWVDGKRAGVA